MFLRIRPGVFPLRETTVLTGGCGTGKKAKDLALENLNLSPFSALWNWTSPFTSLNFNLLIFQVPDFQDYES